MTDSTRDRITEALQHIADGRGTLADFAKDRGLSYFTLKNQFKEKYDETGAESLPHLLAIYFRKGLVQ